MGGIFTGLFPIVSRSSIKEIIFNNHPIIIIIQNFSKRFSEKFPKYTISGESKNKVKKITIPALYGAGGRHISLLYK